MAQVRKIFAPGRQMRVMVHMKHRVPYMDVKNIVKAIVKETYTKEAR
jgi:hypothetical protein